MKVVSIGFRLSSDVSVFFCSKHVRSPTVGLRGLNLFVICATLFYVVSGRFSASKCQVVFGCFRIFRLFMMYKSCWRFLGRSGYSLCFICCKVGFKMF